MYVGVGKLDIVKIPTGRKYFGRRNNNDNYMKFSYSIHFLAHFLKKVRKSPLLFIGPSVHPSVHP